MTNDQYKIYKYVAEHPNTKIDDVIAATQLSRSQVYKILSTHLFSKKRVRIDKFNYMSYVINDSKTVTEHQIPNHHEIHQAFWGNQA
jgi:hypothetical protein